MCDAPHHRLNGWQRWQPVLTQPELVSTQAWTDLSHTLHNDIPVPKIFPKPLFSKVRSIPEFVLNVSHMDMVTHLGTHLDAPAHVFANGPTIEQIPPAYFHGSGVVWRIDLKAREPITKAVLQACQPEVRAGDFVLLSTGWGEWYGTDQYFESPYLTEDAAHWLVEQGVKCVGIDFVSPELPFSMRPERFDYPVHRILLGHGVLVIENLASCRTLEEKRVEVVCGALKIEGSDGSPARIFAREATIRSI